MGISKLTLYECDDEVENLWVDEEEEDVGELEEVAREQRQSERLEQRRGDPRRRLIVLQHLNFKYQFMISTAAFYIIREVLS